jgi:hypothetical protein
MTDPIYRRRVLCQHFVRAMAHARRQFEALIGERDYWRGRCSEIEEALARTARELDRVRADRDLDRAARDSRDRLIAAQKHVIALYEQREQHWRGIEDRKRFATPIVTPHRLH